MADPSSLAMNDLKDVEAEHFAEVIQWLREEMEDELGLGWKVHPFAADAANWLEAFRSQLAAASERARELEKRLKVYTDTYHHPDCESLRNNPHDSEDFKCSCDGPLPDATEKAK